MNDHISKAIDVLNQGGVIIFPTDTAFGIGCKINDKDAIKRLFKIRKRPLAQATPVLVNGLEMASGYVKNIPKDVIEKLIKLYWPGALTIVLPCIKEKVPFLVRGGGNNLGLRMPDHEIPLRLIKGLGIPLLGPSANFHGQATPYTFRDIDKSLLKSVDFILEGKTKGINFPSTVIDTTGNPWKILRKGALDVKI